MCCLTVLIGITVPVDKEVATGIQLSLPLRQRGFRIDVRHAMINQTWHLLKVREDGHRS